MGNQRDDHDPDRTSKGTGEFRDSRRALLSILGGGAVGGAILDTWKPPVVETLLLPAHAQTTPRTAPGGSGDSDPCSPDCTARECGDDGCGGDCGSCPPGQVCIGGQCVNCSPNCSGIQCGDDGCGGSCGDCPPGQICVNGQCVTP